MSQHTPGPWGQIVKMDGFTAVGAKTLIARVFSEKFRDTDNEQANARLIAAAPDLLAACRRVIEINRHGMTAEEGREAVAMCEAAVAKAEGQ